MNDHNLGWLPDVKDHRDILWSATNALPRRAVIKAEDLPMVEDQGRMNSCTAQAGVGCLEIIKLQKANIKKDYSRLFLYKVSRDLANLKGDVGCYIRSTAKAMAKYGVCEEYLWPYLPPTFENKPNSAHLTDAAKSQSINYYSCSNLLSVKDALSKGYPVMFGFSVYDHTFNPPQGNIVLPSDKQSLKGGHAVVAYGYDDDKQRVLIRNSWGAKWGVNGYGTLSYQYWDKGLASDCWAIADVEI